MRGRLYTFALLASFSLHCLFIPIQSKEGSNSSDAYHIDYSFRSFVTEGRNFPVEHMDKYPYYKKIQEAFANKVASMNEGSTKKKKLNIYIEIISEIEKPSNIWVNLSILTFRIVPLWFQHRIQVRYIVRDSVTRVEYSYPMDYDIYYSIALAPIALFGSISDRYQNYPASRVADSLDLFLSDFASRENGITSGGEK